LTGLTFTQGDLNVKPLYLALILATFSTWSHADDLSCRQSEAGADSGYRVVVSEDQTQAIVQQVTFAGAQVVGQLTCGHVVTPKADTQAQNCPEQGCLKMVCFNHAVKDEGYYLKLYQDDKAAMSMILLEENVLGSRYVAVGPCQ
jgi:hypothetical protein